MITVASSLNMSELVQAYGCYLRQERMRSPATVKRYLAVIEQLASFLANPGSAPSVSLESVEKVDLVQFLKRQAPEGESPSRVVWNIRLAALRSFYDWLFKTEVVSVNPAMRIDRLKTNPQERQPLSLDEYLDLVEAARSGSTFIAARNTAMLEVLFHCALRISEVISLDLDQVDLDNYLLTNVRTKGSKWLSAPLNDLTAEALERYLAQRQERQLGSDVGALFVSTRGQRLSVRAAEEMVKTTAAKAGIKRPVGPHLVRHSGATELADLGTPIRVVQEILGHGSLTTTQRYVHVKGTARRRAIDALGQVVAKRQRQRKRAKPTDSELQGNALNPDLV